MVSISLIVVCYNSATTIRRALDSIEAQTKQPEDLIIIDGNSQDETLKIINEYSHLVTKLVSEDDKGIYNAMNKGLALASMDVVGFLNSDDEFSGSTSLEIVGKAFSDNSNARVFVSGVDYFRKDKTLSRKWRLISVETFKSGWHPPHPGFYAETKLLIGLGGFNEVFSIASDFDLMLRAFNCVKKNEVVVDRGKIVNMYLGGTSNNSIRNILSGNSEIRTSLRDNGIKVTWIYTFKRLSRKIFIKWFKK